MQNSKGYAEVLGLFIFKKKSALQLEVNYITFLYIYIYI